MKANFERLRKRLVKCRDHIFNFLENPREKLFFLHLLGVFMKIFFNFALVVHLHAEFAQKKNGEIY